MPRLGRKTKLNRERTRVQPQRECSKRQRLGENPRSGKRKNEEPDVEATVVNEPKNEEPVVKATVVNEPMNEEPIVEATVVNEPKNEENQNDDDTISTLSENTYEKREEGNDNLNEEEETKDEEKKDESDKPNENDLDDAALLLGLRNPACNMPPNNEPPADPKKRKFLDAFGGDEKEYERLEAYIKMDDDPTKFADYPKAIDKRRQRGSLKANQESMKYTHEKPKTVDNFLKSLRRIAEEKQDYEAAKQYVNTHCRVFAAFLDAEMPKKKAKAPSDDSFRYCQECTTGILENHKEKALAKAQKNKAPAAFKLCSTCDEKVKCFAENKKSKKKRRGITNVDQTVDLGLKKDDNKNSIALAPKGPIRARPGATFFKIGLDRDSLFLEVRKSSIEGAGLGLFSLRNFNQWDVIGLYCADRIHGKTKPNEFSMTKGKNRAIYQCQRNEAYMGMHFINDPTFGYETDQDKIDMANVMVDDDFQVIALRPIKAHEELFLIYNGELRRLTPN